VWLLLVIFGGFIVDLVANAVSPVTGSTADTALPQAQLNGFIKQLLPGNLYGDITAVILNPRENPAQRIPGSIGQLQQAVQQIPNAAFSVQQSLLLVWPQIVALLALTLICFGAAYVAFMRQEVRA
jgi:ABC-2 type transport system permease protein